MTEGDFRAPFVVQFSLGSIFAASFRIIGRSFVPFVLVILGGVGVQICSVWLLDSTAHLLGEYGQIAAFVLLGTLIDAALTGYMTVLALTVLEEGRPDWRRAVARTLMVLFQLALPAFCFTALLELEIPILLGLANLAIVLVFSTFTWVYAAVIVREGGNPLSAFRRNLQLTRGRRPVIFGLLAFLFIGAGAAIVLAKLFLLSALESLILVGTWSVGGVIELVLILGLSAFAYIVAAVGYHILRAEIDEPEHENIAKVFE
jgi:hypothetical protein